ncbi:hypothetical protein NA56DRAFT_644221 [Hyaloscypha hepaticicola]|uniref:RanBD1 domain-containing protein n=1 Tax=Hyaloscypha hepaticicola TaxID=2082293 RepID=A0A2J6QAR0_9HELO|nr:hypothetical protein NA56DRAFT_644221 [Hyaloscypha hepaticicola]
MSSSAAADAVAPKRPDQLPLNPESNEPDVMQSNQDLPARTMVDEDKNEQAHAEKDDPATTAAREELKHTSISDRISPSRVEPLNTEAEPEGEDKQMKERVGTPELEPSDAQDEEMRERLSSPKKKRGRDQDDDTRELDDGNTDVQGSAADGSGLNGNRTIRSGPEKKRPRDTSEEGLSKSAEKATEEKADAVTNPVTKVSTDKEETTSQSTTAGSEKPKTSASAFASSGFASLANTSTSPFVSLGASKPSIFSAGAQPASSGFGALAGKPSVLSSTTPASGFGALTGDKPASGFGFGSGTTSGFGGLSTGSVFGSKLGNGFAGGAGPKLSSFAAPGKENEIIGTKPAKAFGAPESDEDDGSDDEDSEGGEGSDEDEGFAEEKKKSKLHKVHIDDGEAGEATLLQLRAKLFAIESKDAGWKERGVGTLKINVPKSCVSYDENGQPIPGSFDASGLEDEDADPNAPQVARLIMRQENTHRVILNTIIVRAMEFKPKPATSTAQILFTAFEGDKEPKPINMLLKVKAP